MEKDFKSISNILNSKMVPKQMLLRNIKLGVLLAKLLLPTRKTVKNEGCVCITLKLLNKITLADFSTGFF